ncbi:MAG: sugar ABC transporter permease [Alphaproteobacteria bacterium]|nr:sugar ABC transporter permease [Alphaproteobacteria bacterium]
MPLAQPLAQRVLSVRWMILPAVLFALALIVFPFGYAIWLSVQDYRFGETPSFIGAGNYVRLAGDPEFWNGLRLTLILYLLSLALQLVLGTALGLLVNRVERLRGLVRTMMMSPFMLPPVVVGMMSIVILDPGLGAANYVLKAAGLPTSDFFASANYVIFTIAAVDSWQWTPFVALIVLGGLQSISPRVEEAAEIDGAHGWRKLVYITLPMLGPTLVTAAVLRSVDLLRFFDIIYITTEGGPGFASTTLNILAYQRGFKFFEIGYASALMITLSTIVLGSVLVFSRLRRAVTW